MVDLEEEAITTLEEMVAAAVECMVVEVKSKTFFDSLLVLKSYRNYYI